jgi:hypothetical protein
MCCDNSSTSAVSPLRVHRLRGALIIALYADSPGRFRGAQGDGVPFGTWAAHFARKDSRRYPVECLLSDGWTVVSDILARAQDEIVARLHREQRSSRWTPECSQGPRLQAVRDRHAAEPKPVAELSFDNGRGKTRGQCGVESRVGRLGRCRG